MFVDLNDSELIESLKFLLVSNEEKIQMETKSFDENKNCWVPNPKTVFIGATIDSTNGSREHENGQYVTVVTDNLEVVDVKRTEILDMNSPKYDKCEDMSNMTHLNDATIIHNLKERYLDCLIYVSFPHSFFSWHAPALPYPSYLATLAKLTPLLVLIRHIPVCSVWSSTRTGHCPSTR